MRDAGLRPGMSPVERRKRIEAVLPPAGEPWAPPGRCATLWLILAEALENGHDAAGAELVHEMTEAGSVRALRLRWRSPMRNGWAAEAPILHLDATLRPGTRPDLPAADRYRHARRRAPAACPRPPGDRQPDLGPRPDALAPTHPSGTERPPRPDCATSAPGSTSGPGSAIAPARPSICWWWARRPPSTRSGRPDCRRGSRRCISTR